MSLELKTFKADKEAYKQFKSLCDKEGVKIGEKLNEMIKEELKIHGDGNPAFTLDQFTEKEFLAFPAIGRSKKDIAEWIDKAPENLVREFEEKAVIVQNLVNIKNEYGSCANRKVI